MTRHFQYQAMCLARADDQSQKNEAILVDERDWAISVPMLILRSSLSLSVSLSSLYLIENPIMRNRSNRGYIRKDSSCKKKLYEGNHRCFLPSNLPMHEVTAQLTFNIVVVCDAFIPSCSNRSRKIKPKDCRIGRMQNCWL